MERMVSNMKRMVLLEEPEAREMAKVIGAFVNTVSRLVADVFPADAPKGAIPIKPMFALREYVQSAEPGVRDALRMLGVE